MINAIGNFIGGNVGLDPTGGYPEYPGAALTEAIITYASVVDPTKTNLKARVYFPTGATNLPMYSVIHGFDESATDISPSEDFFRRVARTGKFVIAFEMRGSSGSGGTITFANDAGGRQKFDVRDGEDAIEAVYAANLAYVNSVLRREIHGWSFGNTVAIGMAISFPDRYVNVTSYFPVVDCLSWDTWLLANSGAARSAALRTYIGGTPAAKPDEWACRDGNNVGNILSEMFFAADTEDASVGVSQSQNFAAALLSASKTYTYLQSTIGDPIRYTHGSVDTHPDLITLEPLWKNKVKTGSIKSIGNSGTLRFHGHLQTRPFKISGGDGNINNAGRSRTATVVYNIALNSYQVTNTSSLWGIFTVTTAAGLIDSQVIDAGATATLTPIAQTVGGYAVGVRFKVHASRVLKDGSNNVTALCDLVGGVNNQGYSIRITGSNRPLYVASMQNSLPGIRFTSASSHYLQGELIKSMQAKSKFTRITVSTGVIVSHGAGGFELTQIALAGGSYFHVVASGGSAPNGSYVGTAATLVRVEIWDGTQATNILKMVLIENKVTKTVTFSGTLPSVTESNASSVYTVGKRSHDATFFGGDYLDDIWIPDVAMTPTEANAAADILKAEYAI